MAIFRQLAEGFLNFTWQQGVMILIGLVLIVLAIKKEYEPMLLLPMGFGAIMANIPLSAAVAEDGFLTTLYNAGIVNELFPILIFVGVGAMIDFSPLLKQPVMLFFGAAAQFGIFVAMLIAAIVGELTGLFNIREAAAIGIIGAADGPSSIYVARLFAERFIAPISVAAYSYMALVPLIQPPVIKALTTKKERMIRMDAKFDIEISRTTKIIFPIAVTVVAGFIAPMSVPLVGGLMYGNLIRECGVLERLSKSAQNELSNLVTLLLGLVIGSTMLAENFLTIQTILILGIGLVAFIFDTAGGVIFAKVVNLFLKRKINPIVGACGISAFPMSARIAQKVAQEEDPTNFILMPAIGANVSGQIGSIIAAAVILAMLA